MLYKPKYCCSCGDRIERVDWKILTSRKFCELCETEYKFEEMLPKVAVLLLVIFGLWGGSSLFFNSEESLVVKETPGAEESRKNAKRSLKTNNIQADSSVHNLSNEQETSTLESGQITPENSASQQSLLSERNSLNTKAAKDTQKKSGETVYFCGAETKKGTPCSRRVRGGGRCWQHKDREAMLPVKDLIAEEQ